MTTATATEIPPFLERFATMHAAMRRDLRVLPGAVRRLDGGGRRQPATLADWYQRFHAELVHHHEREDQIVWPALVERAPGFAADRAVLEEDHHALDAALDRVGSCLRGLAAGGHRSAQQVGVAADAAEHLRGLLEEHLDREEAAAFGRIEQNFTAEEFEALEEAMGEGMGLRDFAFVLPWVLDGLPAAEAAVLVDDLPAPVRLLDRLVFTPRYRRLAAPLR